MTTYYNEHDPAAAAWLRELIDASELPPGTVDERDIRDVKPTDLTGFTQCHFFAGIGGWPLALRQAGWPGDKPVWTGSCPCPPFSSAGKKFRCPICDEKSPVPNAVRTGMFNCIRCGHEWEADERHLWPEFFRLIRHGPNVPIFGEQVGSKDGKTWFDIVRASLEMLGNAVRVVNTPAASVGAPHIRQRIWFAAERVAYAKCRATERHRYKMGKKTSQNQSTKEKRKRLRINIRDGINVNRLADADSEQCNGWSEAAERDNINWKDAGWSQGHGGDASNSTTDRMANADSDRSQPGSKTATSARQGSAIDADGCDAARSGPVNGYWRDADWLFCRDGKWRPVESGTSPLVNGVSADMVRVRYPGEPTAEAKTMRLRGYGNAINIPQAVEFIRST